MGYGSGDFGGQIQSESTGSAFEEDPDSVNDGLGEFGEICEGDFFGFSVDPFGLTNEDGRGPSAVFNDVDKQVARTHFFDRSN